MMRKELLRAKFEFDEDSKRLAIHNKETGDTTTLSLPYVYSLHRFTTSIFQRVTSKRRKKNVSPNPQVQNS